MHCDPDLGQLHPQRHRRPFRRRRGRRDRGPAARTREILRQWSTLHPEFRYLPRKFKIAVTGAAERPRGDRSSTTSACDREAERGGRARLRGLCRRRPGPHADDRPRRSATSCRRTDLLAYFEAILRVYNLHGRRDNKFKARIKILVHETGVEEIRDEVEAEFAQRCQGALDAARGRDRRDRGLLRAAALASRRPRAQASSARRLDDPAFARWVDHNVEPHKRAGLRDRRRSR